MNNTTEDNNDDPTVVPAPQPELVMQENNMAEFVNDFDDWICGICQEGDSNYGAKTMYSCGYHEFHTRCLIDMQVRDIRCAICRYPPSAPSPVFSQSQSTHVNFSQSTQSVPSSPEHHSTPTVPYSLLHLDAFHLTRPNFMIPRDEDIGRLRPSYEEVHGVEDFSCVHCRLPLWQYTIMTLNCGHYMYLTCMLRNMR